MESPSHPNSLDAVAALFRVPPEQFTAARNQLVAELRRTGRAPDASALAKLSRPTPVVWAINQAAHHDRAAVDRLVTAAEQLKRAQLGRPAADVPTLARAYQDAVATLVERSLAQLTAAGRAMTAATRHRLTGTLMAAATDPTLRESLRAGQLTREQTTAGFDVFGDARPALRVVRTAAATRPGRPQLSSKAADLTRRRAEARVRLETARADLARAEARAQELAKAEAALAQTAAEAHRRAAVARRETAQGRADVARARAQVTEAQRAVKGDQ